MKLKVTLINGSEHSFDVEDMDHKEFIIKMKENQGFCIFGEGTTDFYPFHSISTIKLMKD
jgi:hypothetical protein